MRQRSKLRNILEYAAAVAAMKLLEWAPLPVSLVLARGCTRLLDLGIPRLRGVALRNLELTMPELDRTQRARIASGVFDSIARLLVAFAKFPRIGTANVSDWIRYEGYEHFERGLARGKGVLFATAHLGNWELSAFAHSLMSAPMHIMVRPLDNPFIDALVERRRALSGNYIVEKSVSALAVFRALKANHAVGILIDQNAAPENGVFVDFFGVPACATVGLAKLAAHTGATVIPGFALWEQKEHRYVLRFYEPIEITGDAQRDTQALASSLEAVIRDYPDQWLWIHRRWKTRPPNHPPLY